MRFLLTAVCFFIMGAAGAQSLKLSGKVVNEKNEPLSKVSIQITGGTGASTDVDGNFTLILFPGKKYELVVSAVGFATKTISDVEAINGQINELNIVLQTTTKDLTNIVVSTN